jgi:hypothetical protein
MGLEEDRLFIAMIVLAGLATMALTTVIEFSANGVRASPGAIISRYDMFSA